MGDRSMNSAVRFIFDFVVEHDAVYAPEHLFEIKAVWVGCQASLKGKISFAFRSPCHGPSPAVLGGKR